MGEGLNLVGPLLEATLSLPCYPPSPGSPGGGKMGTLRKLRSKTLSLFSQDGGGTLPR